MQSLQVSSRPPKSTKAWPGTANSTSAGEVSNIEKEDREVRGQVAGREPESLIFKLEATMCLSSPRERAPRHDEDARAVFV